MNYAAIDLGAESGRVMLGRLGEGRLQLEEIHRFPTRGTPMDGAVRWDIPRFWREIVAGLTKAAQTVGGDLCGIGVDTWGVNLVYLDGDNQMVELPRHYRDGVSVELMEKVKSEFGTDEIFNTTGIQFMPLNGLIHLYLMVHQHPEVIARTRTIIMIPDIITYMLTGRVGVEYTNATTTQLLDGRTRVWADNLFAKLGLNTKIMGDIIPTGSLVGPVLPNLAAKVGAPGVPVYAVATHDTGSAVAAVPAVGKQPGEWAYLSSGTWSLLGAEVPEPIITPKTAHYNFTNEGGAFGTIRLLKNIMGLWLVQRARQEWNETRGAREPEWTYARIAEEAQGAEPFQAFLFPDDMRFLNPDKMLPELRGAFGAAGFEAPATVGGTARAVFESLAMRYREVVGHLEDLLGQTIKHIYVVGGGTQNALLQQFTADATGRPVTAGPVEATAAGNVLMQAVASGEIASADDIRRIVYDSFEMAEYQPRHPGEWDAAYERYLRTH